MTAPHPRRARSGPGLRMLRAAMFAAVCVVLAAAGHGIASCAAVPMWTLGAGFLAVFSVAAPLAGRERTLPGIAAVLAVGQTALHTLFGLGTSGSMAAGSGSPTTADMSLVERAARIVCGATAASISPAQAQRILADARLDTDMTQSMPMSASSMDSMSAMSAMPMHHPADAVSSAAGSSMGLLPSLPMLLGHVLAAVAAGWVLRHGDLALLRLMRLSAHGVAEGALVRALRAALALVRALRAGLPGTPGVAPRTPRRAPRAAPEPHTTALQHSVVRRGPPRSGALVLAA
ncbi:MULTISPECIES: hypothetical protein [unclassified Streptomyces]|uniref:hypothetical protein n=1 Tax=unclassified Streptomyces TaxID=2593676 RepID=UPI0011CD9A9A|nr:MULTISPECIES: hypothetical protein [unclassified Streptomyces]TXS76978.1 hypothetical protein EAO69_11770 [Streptomyces sp. me109]